ncbi:MAG: hypothetical protein ACREBB_08505 [Nitrosotalea sp.]
MKSKQIAIQKDRQPEPAARLVVRSPVEEGKRSIFQEENVSRFSMIRVYTPEKLRRIKRYARKRFGGKQR